VSQQRRAKLEKLNSDLLERVSFLEEELDKQIEFNKSLKEKQKEYNLQVYKQLVKQLDIPQGEGDSEN
jgi:hypothetical protein